MDQGGDRRARGPCTAIARLDHRSKPEFVKGTAVNAFRPDFRRDPVTECGRKRGAQPSVPGNHARRRSNAVADAGAGGASVCRQFAATRKQRESARPVAERRAQCGGPASVDTVRVAHHIDADHHFHDAKDGLLYRVGEVRISGLAGADGLRQGQHAGVLAAAVIVDAFGAFKAPDLIDHRLLVGGPVTAAGQERCIETEPGEQPFHGIDMFRLAVVAATDESKLGRGRAPVNVKRVPRLGKSDRLEGLHRRSGENRAFDIAKTKQHRAVRVAQGNIDGMAAFLGARAQYRDVERAVRMIWELDPWDGHDASARAVPECSHGLSPVSRHRSSRR